ncbi:hypothetical protein BDQ17DRAFT_1405353 [Cyathus striatus]|nr:hypothetical protein BDQ17DRAFT_1405353 [Cyathus striatus]
MPTPPKLDSKKVENSSSLRDGHQKKETIAGNITKPKRRGSHTRIPRLFSPASYSNTTEIERGDTTFAANFADGARDMTLNGTTIVNVAGDYALIHEMHVRHARSLLEMVLTAGLVVLMFVAVEILRRLGPFPTATSVTVWNHERI